MGSDIQKGTIYAEGGVGGSGTVNAANLNAHVDEARVKATFISSKSLKDPASLDDSLIVESAGVLYRQTHQQIVDLINQTIQSLLPIGTIVDYGGANAPAGWLMCFGQAISRVDFDELFSIVGVAYGSGNGVDTFNIPDLRGRIAAGKDNMGGVTAGRLTASTISSPVTLGGSGGADLIALVASQMPSHNHTGVNHTHGFSDYYTTETGRGNIQYGNDINQGGAWLANQTGGADRDLSTGYAGGNGGHNNVQPTLILNKMIRAI